MAGNLRIEMGSDFVEPQSDIEIYIDFQEDSGSSARVFEIAADLIRALEELDNVLISSVDSEIKTSLILEDIQKSSLKIFLKNVLKQLDDQALKDLDWKPLVGQYLVKAKYIALQWLDRDIGPDEPAGIEDLTQRFRTLAAHTDVLHLPYYPQPNAARLAQPLDRIQRVKQKFREGESLTITLDKTDYKVDLNRIWLPSEHMSDVKAEQELSNTVDMVLVIRKPDLLGKSQWQFRHGKKPFNAPIEDENWLEEFHAGKHPLSPGDALRVRVKFDYKYDKNGDLTESIETILKVQSVIKAGLEHPDLFEEV